MIPRVPLCGAHSAMQTLLCPNKWAEQVWAEPGSAAPGQAPLAWHLQRALGPAFSSSSPALCVHPIFRPTCSDLLPSGPQMPSLPLGSWSSQRHPVPSQSLLVLEAEAFPEFLLQVGHTGSPVSMPAHLTEGQGGSEGPHTF